MMLKVRVGKLLLMLCAEQWKRILKKNIRCSVEVIQGNEWLSGKDGEEEEILKWKRREQMNKEWKTWGKTFF